MELCVQCSKPNDRMPLQRCSVCSTKHKKYISFRHERVREVNKRWRWELKIDAMCKIAKGEPRCCVCGINDLRLLNINHLDGRTQDERNKYSNNSSSFYKDIIDGKRNISDLDIRSWNHNILYDYERGIRTVPSWI